MIDLGLFVTVFGAIFIAELPDKTAEPALDLSTRHKPLPYFMGTALAQTVQSVVAIAAGSVLAQLPERPVHIGAGMLFIISGIVMWRRKEETSDDIAPDTAVTSWQSFTQTFLVVFIAEWGDLTQLGTAALAARYKQPLTVFCGATLALWAVAALAVFVGNRAGAMLDADLTKRIAAVVFVLLGVALIAGLI